MKKSVLVVFIMLFIQTCVHSQNIYVTGRVMDSVQHIPVNYCSISLIDQQTNKVVNGAISDAKGNFSVPVTMAGIYQLKAEFIGYKPVLKANIKINESSIDIGNIYLHSSVTTMQAIKVTGSKTVIENKIDKLVYNAVNDVTSQGGVALDVLKKVPMVSVDIDGNVELQGNSSIRFLINGKPSSIFGASLIDALQSIPASQIKSIEVITSPGAKYDAAGTGGIINIILKDSKVQGINSSINISAGTRLENGSFNLNARKENIGFGLSFGGNEQLKTTIHSTTNRTSYNETMDSINQLYQQSINPFIRNSYHSEINFNWTITPKNEFTASLNFDHFTNHGTANTTQDQQGLLQTGSTFADIISTRNSDSRFHERATEYDLDYKKTFKKEDQYLEVLYSSSVEKNANDASQLTIYTDTIFLRSGLRSNNPGRDHEVDMSVDYAQPVNKGFVIETGVKLVIEDLTNNVVTDTLLNNGNYMKNPNQTYGFTYNRNIYAAYLSSSFSLFNDFINGKAGLRYERTTTIANFTNTAIPEYNTFVPSFVVQHKLGETQSIKFSYNYRIERPDYGALNPFYNISDPHNINTGNPLLKPEKGHNYELGYNKNFTKGGNIYVAAFYRHNTDDIQALITYYDLLNVNGTDFTNVTLRSQYNIGVQTNVGASIFGSVPVTPKLNLRSNIDLSERTNSTPGYATSKGFTYRVNLNASYQFPKDFTAEIFGNYRSSVKNIQSTRPASFFYNLAMKKQFLHKNASIGFTTANPFSRYITQKSSAFGSNFNQENIRLVPSQSFGITLSYKFGKLQFKKNEKEDKNDPLQPSL